MASFAFDDPVGDLLSDGSNDSFFEDPKPKVLSKRPSITKTTEKKNFSEIFGLSEDTNKSKDITETPIQYQHPPEFSKKENLEDDWLGLGDTKKSEEPAEIKSNPKKITFEEDEEILSSLGLNKKSGTLDVQKSEVKVQQEESKKVPTKRSTLFDDILGTKPTQNTSNLGFGDLLNRGKPDKKSDDGSKDSNKSAASVAATREGRRARFQQSGISDPLGLFKNETKSLDYSEGNISQLPKTDASLENVPAKEINLNVGAGDTGTMKTEVLFSKKDKDFITQSAPNITELPNWLGGFSLKQHVSEPEIKGTVQDDVQKRRSSVSEKPVESNERLTVQPESYAAPTKPTILDNPLLDSLLTQQKLNASNLEYQNTSLALQQQESQVLLALQLKKYEENLMQMQFQQREILTKQEQQFNSLIEKQLAKQQIIENNMRLQQERINNRIQVLMSQPSVSTAAVHEDKETEIVKEELNKSRYEDIISSLTQKQHEEMFLVEESYKKQIDLLEQTAKSIETHLKSELSIVRENYEENLKQMESYHQEEILKYKQRIQEMLEQQSIEIKLLRENHTKVIEEIKNEYLDMIANFKQTKQMEKELLDNPAEYSHKLDTNIKQLDNASRALFEMYNKIEKQDFVLNLAREENFKSKEEEIRLMRITLEKSRETYESERAQLMGLVRSLESKLAEQIQNGKEESWALQQAAATLVARTSALDREAEFNRNLLEREREQIKTLKQSVLEEQERNMLIITEEKLALQAEKSRLETKVKLTESQDPQRGRAEIEAAILVAKEAAELTDKEREKLHRKQYEMETIKRNLLDREQKLSLKEKELEGLTQEAERKIKEGEKALNIAKELEIKYTDRLRDLQNQMVSLTNREKKLTEEKISLSKERLALHTAMRQNRQCRLCAADNHSNFTIENNAWNEHVDINVLNFDMATDPQAMRLRLLAEDEKSDFQIEQ